MSHECSTFRRLHKNKIDLYCLTLLISNKLRNAHLKGSYDVAKKNIILCIWCNAMCLCGLGIKKNLFSTYCTFLLLLYAPPFWNAPIFTKPGPVPNGTLNPCGLSLSPHFRDVVPLWLSCRSLLRSSPQCGLGTSADRGRITAAKGAHASTLLKAKMRNGTPYGLVDLTDMRTRWPL